MSAPIKYCTTCDRHRNVYKHMRAGFPPDAAEKWLRRTCPHDGDGCDIHYQAGISPALLARRSVGGRHA